MAIEPDLSSSLQARLRALAAPLARVARAARGPRTAWTVGALPAITALAALLVVGACGGGVDSGGTGATPASVTVGPVSGFGSIVVAGIHHDDTTALVVDDDGQPLGSEALRLGTMTVVEGSAIVSSGVRRESTARHVRVVEQVVGPVDSVDAAGGVLVVLGQRVVVTPTTVFDAKLAGGLAAVGAGATLAIHGQLDVAADRIVATRIEPRPQAAAYVLRATVARYDRVARRLALGGLEIDLAAVAAADLPESLPAGTLARVKLLTAPAGPLWRATGLRAARLVVGDGGAVQVEGRITRFASPQDFSVDGVPVDARAATFEGGTAGLAVGARVEVEGRAEGGAIVARKVEIESDDGSDGRTFELEGRITAVDAGASTFVLRGLTVSYAGGPAFEGGSAADLTVNRRVAVKGRLSADGTRLVAISIHIEA